MKKLNKKAKKLFEKQNNSMMKCWCGSIKPIGYRVGENFLKFYCEKHKPKR